MDLNAFIRSLQDVQPPAGLSPLLTALWHTGQGNWEAGHAIAQDIPGRGGACVHAYLHRQEGDLWNADYWYRQAGRTRPDIPLEAEWEQLVAHFLTAE